MLLESCLDIHKNSATLSRLCTGRMWPFPLQRATALMWAGRSQSPFNIRLITHFQTCGSSRLDHCGPSSGNRPFFFVSLSRLSSVTSSAQHHLGSLRVGPSGFSPLSSQTSRTGSLLAYLLVSNPFFLFSKIKKWVFKMAGLSLVTLGDVSLLDGCKTCFF